MTSLGESNIRPLAILGSYLSLACLLTASILRTLYQISQRSRDSQPDSVPHRKRRKHLLLFATLSALSLGTTWYYMLAFFTLSYRTWAQEAGISLPAGMWGYNRLFAGSEDAVELQLGRWLKDTTLFRDAWETVIDGSLRFWWSQQIFLITTAWSVYLGVEGRRLAIPPLWTFMLLGQIVAISFAMNLFFLALLLSPRPSTEVAFGYSSPESTARKDKKPTEISGASNASSSNYPPENGTWTSFQGLASTPARNTYTVPLLLDFISILFIPYTVHSSLFLPVLAIPHILLFLPVVNYEIIPQKQQVAIYRFVFVLSLFLHVKATAIALLDDHVDVHTYKDLFAFLYCTNSRPKHRQYRSRKWIIFGELLNHPAVSSVGCDVILCWSSAIIWAVIQGPNSWRLLKEIVFPWRNTIKAETPRPRNVMRKEASKDE